MPTQTASSSLASCDSDSVVESDPDRIFFPGSQTTSILVEKFPELDNAYGFINPCRYLVDSAHIQTFTHALHAIVNFSSRVYICPDVAGLCIKSCNSAHSESGYLNFANEFFGAIHTYDWPEAAPFAALEQADILLVLKRLEAYKTIDHVVLDLESTCDSVVLHIAYRSQMSATLAIPTCEVYANSMPPDLEPQFCTSVMHILGNDFKKMSASLGKNSREVGKKAVDVIAKFAAQNDAVLKFYFTEGDEPLFVVVELHSLCSVVFILATSQMEPQWVKTQLEDMCPGYRRFGRQASIRVVRVEDQPDSEGNPVVTELEAQDPLIEVVRPYRGLFDPDDELAHEVRDVSLQDRVILEEPSVSQHLLDVRVPALDALLTDIVANRPSRDTIHRLFALRPLEVRTPREDPPSPV